MRLARVSCSLDGETVGIEGEEAHHLARVLRLRRGDRFLGFDGSGREGLLELLEVGPRLLARVLSLSSPDTEPELQVTLHLALVKGERFDWAVEKATELGVARVVPLLTERTEARGLGAERRRRWIRLTRAAAAQSGRVRVPEVGEPVPFREALHSPGLILVPGAPPLAGCSSSSLNVLVGPEGGFSPEELSLARGSGLRPVGLGPRTLRVETAAVAALACLLTLPPADPAAS